MVGAGTVGAVVAGGAVAAEVVAGGAAVDVTFDAGDRPRPAARPAWWAATADEHPARVTTRAPVARAARARARRAGPVASRPVRRSVVLRFVAPGLLLIAACACGSGPGDAARARATDTTAVTTTTTSTPATSTTTSTAPPSTAVVAPTTAPAPAFVSSVSPVTAADLPSSWHAGCPVGPDQLRLLHLGYWGFDGQAHVGTMVVAAGVAQAVVSVFSALYGERFPIRKMQPVDAYGGSDPASTADDNTAGFNCRYAVAPGPPSWSVHAYGEAIDVNPVENPYIEGGQVQPPAGAAFTDRGDVRPGMAVPGGQLVGAFAGVGWQWGGRWSGTPDYQHFSATGG